MQPLRHCSGSFLCTIRLIFPSPSSSFLLLLLLHSFTYQDPAKTCHSCDAVMGTYFCKECKLWSSNPDINVYHCDKCGLCRLGKGLGIDNFHCERCGICLSLNVRSSLFIPFSFFLLYCFFLLSAFSVSPLAQPTGSRSPHMHSERRPQNHLPWLHGSHTPLLFTRARHPHALRAWNSSTLLPRKLFE